MPTRTENPTRWTAATILSAACRLALAAIWIISGATKMADPLATRQSVAAYELFSPALVNLIGTALPPIEVALGALILLGIFLRPTAILSALIFAGFIAGIASAWARGLTIDCGCFGAGGYNADVNWWTYTSEIIRDIGFILLAAVVAFRPFKRFALYP